MQVSTRFFSERTRTVSRIAADFNITRVCDTEQIGAISLIFWPKDGTETTMDVRLSFDEALELAADLLKQASIERKNQTAKAGYVVKP